MYKIQELENGHYWLEFRESDHDFEWSFTGEFARVSDIPTAEPRKDGLTVEKQD